MRLAAPSTPRRTPASAAPGRARTRRPLVQFPKHGAPQQDRKQEGGRHGLVRDHPRIGVAKPPFQHLARIGVRRQLERRRRERNKCSNKPYFCSSSKDRAPYPKERASAPHRTGAPAARRRADSPACGSAPRYRIDGEPELCRKAHRPQHADRIFTVASLRIADELQPAGLHIAHPIDEIPNRQIGDVVVETVRREVASQTSSSIEPYMLSRRMRPVISKARCSESAACAGSVRTGSTRTGSM